MRVSIITPTLNSERYLEETLISLWDDPSIDLEHIIVDGGSNDLTLGIASRYPSRVISDPDDSMYEAINKGLENATGDIFGYVNSDDQVTPGGLATVVQSFSDQPHARWLTGPMDFVDEDGLYLATLRPPKPLSPARYRALGWSCFPQPATFFRRDFAQELGGFDTRFRFVADYDFFARALDHETPLYATQTLARFRLHSSNLSKNHAAMEEEAQLVSYAVPMSHLQRVVRRTATKLQVNLSNPGWAVGKRTGRVAY